MKPRVVFSNGLTRVVRVSPWSYTLEKRVGQDAMRRGIWQEMRDVDVNTLSRLVHTFGQSLVRREKAMRKARRRGGA